MATIVIIPGGGDSALSWGPVCEHLRELGHEPIPVDLPVDDSAAGWSEYADAVVAAMGGKRDVVLVAHSLGGFTAPLVCERAPVRKVVMLAAMIPRPGAIAGEYWSECGYTGAQFDDEAFNHDLSPEARQLAKRAERDQSDRPMGEPSPIARWPDVPTHYLLCRDDRVFPAQHSRRVVRERLGVEPDEIDGGHCVYLARPREVAERLHTYATG